MHLQLEVRFRALSKNENAVLVFPPTWKSKIKKKYKLNFSKKDRMLR